MPPTYLNLSGPFSTVSILSKCEPHPAEVLCKAPLPFMDQPTWSAAFRQRQPHPGTRFLPVFPPRRPVLSISNILAISSASESLLLRLLLMRLFYSFPG